ncbi:hypothetical protein EYC84_005660 [Monilinia fructicola]|uniref:Uncharacterized protein n=1 Tax=Monilinia fructicola TaxID=38448 RepID=A0A5M9K2C5_MONFR|nr:hypothetical protein EYC84_005660 [Monilinia fructicola]
MLMHTDPINPYPIPSIAGYKVSGKRFQQTQELLQVNREETEKIHGMSKRRREQFPAIVEVIEGIICTVPNIKEVIFCGGGNREGVLYLKLPPEIQATHPLLLFPSTFHTNTNFNNPQHPQATTKQLAQILASALPAGHPTTALFTPEILRYIVAHTWDDMANVANVNAARALHAPISGPVAGMPGLTHDVIAVLSLTIIYLHSIRRMIQSRCQIPNTQHPTPNLPSPFLREPSTTTTPRGKSSQTFSIQQICIDVFICLLSSPLLFMPPTPHQTTPSSQIQSNLLQSNPTNPTNP